MKKATALLLTLVLGTFLCACGGATPPQDANQLPIRTVTDALGRTVEIPQTVHKIVPLGNTPRMISYLGLADKIAGISGLEPDKITPLTAYAYVNRDVWANLPRVGTDAMGNIDYYPEVIIGTQADVIFCTYPQDMVNDLENKTGIPVIAVGQGTLFGEDYEQAFQILGEACGVSERAEAVISYIRACLADLDARTSGIADGEKPTVLSAAATFKGAHGIEGVRLADPVLAAVHAKDVAASSASGTSNSVEVDKEQILLWNPDYIFCDYSGVELVRQDAAKNSAFYNQLSAYRNGRIYQYPSSTSYFSNVEIPLANCYFVGSLLYPDRFADIDVTAKANEIIRFFLGTDDYMSVLSEYGAAYGALKFGESR